MIFKITGTILIIMIVAAVIVVSLALVDIGSYTSDAHVSQTLPAKGTMIGTALVVYDPGMSGDAKQVATDIAVDLQNNGYQVNLSGIRSQSAANYSAYNVIVTGGPCYLGTIASSVRNYLKTFHPPQNDKVGAFGIGSITPATNTTLAMIREVVPLPKGSNTTINTGIKIVEGQYFLCFDSSRIAPEAHCH